MFAQANGTENNQQTPTSQTTSTTNSPSRNRRIDVDKKKVANYVSPNFMIELCSALREINITNKQLGEFLKSIDQKGRSWEAKTVSLYLNGARRFTFAMFFDICSHYGLPAKEIALSAFEKEQNDHWGTGFQQQIQDI